MLHFVAPWITVLYKRARRCSTVAPCRGVRTHRLSTTQFRPCRRRRGRKVSLKCPTTFLFFPYFAPLRPRRLAINSFWLTFLSDAARSASSATYGSASRLV